MVFLFPAAARRLGIKTKCLVAQSTRVCAALLLGVAGQATTLADDWPQWMGPNRDNQWNVANALTQFPATGPKIVWRAAVDTGYAGPAVSDGRVFVLDFVSEGDVKVANFEKKEFDGVERVQCLDAATGNKLWMVERPATYAVSYPSGPRCTPLVDEDRVYALGAEGHLLCLEAATGTVIWEQDLKQQYQTEAALWGYASHPLIDGDKLVCIAGGPGSHTVALDKHTGKELWRYGTASEQGYSPPVIIQAGGTRQLILMSPDWMASVDPETGKEYWQEKYEASSGSIIMTPLQVGNYLYVGGYSNRTMMVELDPNRPAAKTIFRDKSKVGISPVNVQPFLDGDVVYGLNGDGTLLAFEIPSGERLWEERDLLGDRQQTGTAFIVRGGEVFYMFAETGELVVAKLSREGYEVLDRAQILAPTNNAFGRPVVWSAPAFAGSKMFARNDKEIVCVELAK